MPTTNTIGGPPPEPALAIGTAGEPNHLSPQGRETIDPRKASRGLDKDGSRTLLRAFSLLDAVAANAPTPQKLSSLALATGLHKATAHRLLSTLAMERFVEIGPKGYSIGARCWALGAASARRFDLSEMVQPSLARIARETQDVGLFSIRTGTHSECIGRVEGDHPVLPTSTKVGSRRPLGCGALALAILAALPDREVEYAIATTEEERRHLPGFREHEPLLHSVAEVRDAGFAMHHSDYSPGAAGIAIPVCDAWGAVIGSIACVAIEERLRPERYPEIIPLLYREKQSIEEQLAGASQAKAVRKPKGPASH